MRRVVRVLNCERESVGAGVGVVHTLSTKGR